MGWGLPLEVGAEKLAPSLESSFPPSETQGKQTLSPGCPGNCARMSPTPDDVQKNCENKVCVAILFAWCRLHFGPGKNRKTIGLGLPQKKGKIKKVTLGFGGHSLIFWLIFCFCLGRPIFPFFGGLFFLFFRPEAQDGVCTRQAGSRSLCSFFGPYLKGQKRDPFKALRENEHQNRP